MHLIAIPVRLERVNLRLPAKSIAIGQPVKRSNKIGFGMFKII